MKRNVNIREESEVVEELLRLADAEGESLSTIYRRAVRLFLATLSTSGKSPKDPEQVAA